MSRTAMIQKYKAMVADWQDRLSTLRDDAERSPEDLKEEYLELVDMLYRDFEEVESRVMDLDQMSEESFAEEAELLEEEASDFEDSLQDARDRIANI